MRRPHGCGHLSRNRPGFPSAACVRPVPEGCRNDASRDLQATTASVCGATVCYERREHGSTIEGSHRGIAGGFRQPTRISALFAADLIGFGKEGLQPLGPSEGH